MGTCKCGYSTDAEKNCNGTHNVVKEVKADIIAKLEANGFAEASDYLKTNSLILRSFSIKVCSELTQ